MKATINLYGETDTKLNCKRMALTACRYVLTNYGPLVYGLVILTLIGVLS